LTTIHFNKSKCHLTQKIDSLSPPARGGMKGGVFLVYVVRHSRMRFPLKIKRNIRSGIYSRLSIILPLFALFIWLNEHPCNVLFAAETTSNPAKTFSAFPILMFDSDIGFGCGGKAVLKNARLKNESLDLILFGSNKGEQWFVLSFSIPDREFRQNIIYACAFDASIEYDKLLKSNYFGIGNKSADNKYQFPKEFLKIDLSLAKAKTTELSGKLGIRLACYSVYDWDAGWGTIQNTTPGVGSSKVFAFTYALTWDNRDSQINPKKGRKIELEFEHSPKFINNTIRSAGDAEIPNRNWKFSKVKLELVKLKEIIFGIRLAARLSLEQVIGTAPYHELATLGGGNTLRGYKLDRFLDQASALTSFEFRLPVGLWLSGSASTDKIANKIIAKIGCVLFADAGRVAPKLNRLNLNVWYWNTGVGLRYYTRDFIVRGDIGFSREGMRLFLNFGHVF